MTDRLTLGPGGLRPLVRRTVTSTVLLGILGAGGLTFLRVEYGVTVGAEGFTRARPLGQPPPTLRGVGTFAFSQHQEGSENDPVAYDPCRKVEYAINTDLSPTGGTELVEQAVQRIARATGLVFERLPDTDEAPSLAAGLSPSPRREPVVIGWTTPEEIPGLAGPVAGLGAAARASTPRAASASTRPASSRSTLRSSSTCSRSRAVGHRPGPSSCTSSPTS